MADEHDDRSIGWRVTWVAGPDAGASRLLAAGRWLVGRAPGAHVRCDDPSLEPFHAELRLWSHGEVQVVQLSGRSPVRHDGGRIRVGASTLVVAPASDATAARPAVIDHRVRRRPRPSIEHVPVAVRVPAPAAEPTGAAGGAAGLASSSVALAGALVVGAVTHQVVFALMAAVAATGSLVVFGGTRVSAARRRRRRRRSAAAEAVRVASEVELQRSAAAAHLREVAPTIARAVAAPGGDGAELWQRRSGEVDAFRVALGEGAVPWRPVLTGGSPDSRSGSISLDEPSSRPLDPVPVVADLGPGDRVLLAGPGAVGVARSVVVQMAALTGPADWRLLVAGERGDRWRWATALPHARRGTGPAVLDDRDLLDLGAAADDSASDPHTVMVVDGSAPLAVRTSPLRRCLAAHPDWAVLVVDDEPTALPPPDCTATLVLTADGGARLTSPEWPVPVELRAAGIGERAAVGAARELGRWLDPDHGDHAAGLVPATVGWDALMADVGIDVDDPASIVEAWGQAPRAPLVRLGRAGDGVVDVDLVRDGPHGLLAGTTGAGKSELLRALVLGLAVTTPPARLTFVLVDFKGGAAFDALVDLPHVVGLVTDLEPSLVDRVLRSLRAELSARERTLRDAGAADVADLADPSLLPRLVVVVDEFAALAHEHPEVLHALVGIARRGRSMGVHLVLATQRPAGVINDEIRANTNLRLALRLHDRADALDVVGDPAPAGFHRSLPGRAAMRLGPDELVVFQAAYVADPARAVGTVLAAADLAGAATARRPWCDPLPQVLASDEMPAGVVGAVDEPDRQRRGELRWRVGDGHLLVAGSRGSGVTSTLRRVAGQAGADEIVVIDALDDPAWAAVADHPACAGVVRPHERERLDRALRRATTSVGRSVLVVIDGLVALRRHLEPTARLAELDALDGLLAAPPAGVTLLVGADGPAGLGVATLGRFAHRWVLHCNDPHDAAALGVPAGRQVAAIAGRCVVLPGGDHGQLANGPLPAPPAGRRVSRVGTLPERVDPAVLPAAVAGDRRWRAPLGIAAADLAPFALDVHEGEHVLVTGPGRSGRSSALVRLAAAFTDATPDGRVLVVAPRRSPLRDLAEPDAPVDAPLDPVLDQVAELLGRGVPVLLAVDDAELVADPSGRLGDLVVGRPAGLVVAAAARAEALRHAYGHWTAGVRRSGLGMVMSAADELAGDLLGIVVPRHPPIDARPGLAWVATDGTCTLVQLACDPPRGHQVGHPPRPPSRSAAQRAGARIVAG